MSGSSKGSFLRGKSSKETSKKIYEYHAHAHREVLSILNVTAEEGLSTAEVTSRQKKYSKNTFTEEKRETVIVHILKQLLSPLAFVLVLAFFVTLSLGEYIDATVIGIALSVAVFVGLLQEGKSSRAFEKLAHSQEHRATVIRDGIKQEIDSAELTVGDIVVLQSGMQVPADVRIVQSKQLSINEAPLTGEWVAVEKMSLPVSVGTPFAEQSSMAWMGTFIAEGYGAGVVVAVGDTTAVGKLAKDVREVEEVKTPIQTEMEKISRVMLYLIGALVLFIFGIGLLQGQSMHDMLLMSIAVAVASVPEGLPAAVTIILAVGMEALLNRGGLVRNLLAAETLGSTTFVLTDKTGTLTQAKMAVTELILNNGEIVQVTEKNKESICNIFNIALAGADAYTDKSNADQVVHGDAVEVAILSAAAKCSVFEDRDSLRANRIDYYGFTSENRFAAGLSEDNEEQILCVNGAPALLLAYATSILLHDGERPITDADKNRIQELINSQTLRGKRLVAVAYKKVSFRDIPPVGEALLESITFAGVLVFDDPVREGVKEAISGVRSAGAQVVLITGDNPQTALSIAKQVGIAAEGDVAFLGSDLEAMSDEELAVALQEVRVFARILPSQKMRIATVLQQKGEIVAMTGDGINDAPALRRANIGISVGSGTEVAKEASDLVLVNDSFETIYAAIEEGRRIIANLRKIVGYLLSTSLSEVMLIAVALLLGSAVPILPVQILWANVIEEGFMSVAFAFEKGDKNAMKRKPSDIHEEGILSKKMLWFTALVVVVHGALLVSLYLYLEYLKLPLEELRSVMFLAVAMDSLFISFAFRSLTTPLWRIPLRNNIFFVGSFIVSGLLLFVVLSVPMLQKILSYTPLPAFDIALVFAFSLSTLVTVEIAKWIFFERED